jgi:RNA 2',3'-cyclic 3'-phosphodiesterase
MRLFIGLDIDAAIRERIAQFVDGVRNFAPDAKWVGPETFHITLKFIGEQPPEDVKRIKEVLRRVKSQPFEISFRGYGFFPNAKSARVFWVGIQASAQLPALAGQVDAATATMGIPREEHAFAPHLTLARARGASGSLRQHGRSGQNTGSGRVFSRVEEKLAAFPEPDFGTMTATEFFLYESKLSPKGAQYFKLERFAFDQSAGNSANNE